MESVRTYLYKLTSDRGGAPCAPAPRGGAAPLLTLAICKPAIRRTAMAGDRIVGIASRALERTEGYAAAGVIYAATVAEVVPARKYYAARSPFRSRPDCIYVFDPEDGSFHHTGATLHAHPDHQRRDLGRFPHFRNGQVVLAREFRYFGRDAQAVPERLPRVRQLAESLGQGHRVFRAGDDPGLDAELHRLFGVLFGGKACQPSGFTPRRVDGDSYDRHSGTLGSGAAEARSCLPVCGKGYAEGSRPLPVRKRRSFPAKESKRHAVV